MALRQLATTTRPGLKYKKWIDAVNAEQLSVAKLRRRVRAEHEPASREIDSIFRGTPDWRKKEIRLSPIKFDIKTMSDGEKVRIKKDLEKLIKALG